MLAAGLALSVISYPVLLAVIVYGAVQTFTRCRSWLRVRAVVRSLQDGVPMNHKISYPNRVRSNLAQFVLLLLFLASLLLHYHFNNTPCPKHPGGLLPPSSCPNWRAALTLSLSSTAPIFSPCVTSQWEVIQIQTFGVEGVPDRLGSDGCGLVPPPNSRSGGAPGPETCCVPAYGWMAWAAPGGLPPLRTGTAGPSQSINLTAWTGVP